MKKTTDKNSSTSIRKIRFSLKLKMVLMVVAILILTVFIIANFVIIHQNELLDSQMEETLNVYLETFKQNAKTSLLERDSTDAEALQSYISTYSEIDNFLMAMFVDNDYTIITHTDPDSRFKTIAKVSIERFEEGYQDELHYEYRYFTNENIYILQNTNISLAWITNIDGEISNVSRIDVTNIENVTSMEIADGVTNSLIVKATNYIPRVNLDAFMPVYLDLNYPTYKSKMRELKNYSGKFDNEELCTFEKVIYTNEALCSALPNEAINNFKFIEVFNEYVDPLITDGAPSELVYDMVESEVITWADYEYLANRRYYLQRYGLYYQFDLEEETVEKTIELLSKLGLNDEQAAEFRKLRKKKRLFYNEDVLSTEQISMIWFIHFVDEYLDEYWDREKYSPTDDLSDLMDFVEKDVNVNGWNYIGDDYYTDKMVDLASLYDGKLLTYLTGSDLYRSDVESAFADMFAPYRVGTVRIIINYDEVTEQRREIVYDTIDIALVFIIRMLLIAFLIVLLLISPVKVLSADAMGVVEKIDAIKEDGSREEFDVGINNLKAFLEKPIYIKSGDELGQLADQINMMTRKFKQTLDVFREKQYELEEAKMIQDALLPQGFPPVKGFKFSVYYEAMAESSGDYYDFIDVDNSFGNDSKEFKRFGIVVADVTNHGVSAAMVMATLRSTLRTYAAGTTNAGEVLKKINPVIFRDTPSKMFATVFYGVVTLVKVKGSDATQYGIVYSSAGHEQAIVYNLNDKKISALETGGMPVGITGNTELYNGLIKQQTFVLRKGDIFVQYTDGFVEAKKFDDENEEFGEKRLFDTIKKYASTNTDSMRDKIVKEVKKFRGDEFNEKKHATDDLTMLIMMIE